MLKRIRIDRQRIMSGVPQKNSVIERYNKTYLNIVRSMLAGTYLSKVFQEETILTTICIINRMPCKAIYTILYENKIV